MIEPSQEAREAANDTVADELAAIIKTTKIGTANCACLMTRELSNGHRYIILTRESYEADVANAKAKIASAYERGKMDERERAERVGYITCAETRHVTLGDKVAQAIREGKQI